jgi:flagellar motility protein MotE (MotC chaperone)
MNLDSIRKNGRRVLVASAVIALAACASAPEPKEQMAVANSAVDNATGNAAEAPAELSTARDKLARANVAMARKDYVEARRLADEAAADAALAQATARTARSSRALTEVRESIQQLQTQLNRS